MNISSMSNLNKKSVVLIVMFCTVLLFSSLSYADLLRSTGKVNFLRVHDVGTKYGPPNDQIDAEVVVKLEGMRSKAFGFKLRNDKNRYAHEGMLDLLRDAFNYNHKVSIEYSMCSGNDVKPPCKNGTIIRVWLEK